MPLVYESGNASNSACFKPLALGDPPFIVSFYRSQDHAGTVNNRGKVNCNYGAADSYKGEFGFDFFDKEVIAEGLSQHYKMLSGIEKADETFGDSKAYLCPYLSIWPPQVDGNMKDKKSTVTLYARLERSSEYDKNDKNLPDNLDVKIVSTDGEVITINSKENNGNSEDTVNLKLEDTLVSITIECKKPFGEEKEVAILAKTRYKKEGSMDVVGKVILYPNAVRYKTTIQPVRINFTAAESSVIKTEPTIELIKDVADAFNTVSFNQAYIHADVEPTMEVVEFAKSQFQTKGEEIIVHKQQPEIIGTGLHDYLEYDEAQVIPNKYNNLVENRYAALAAKQKDSFAKNKAGEDLTLKMQNLLTQFDKYFSYKATGNPIKIRNKKEKMIVKTAWEKPKVQAAYKEYLASRAAYDKILVSSEGLDKTHKIHVFFTSDLFAGRTDDGEVLAYSSRGSGVVHIFNKALTDKDALDTILHEMAHSLGLEHPFDEEANKPYAYKEKGKHYKEDVEKKIDKLEQQIKDYKIKIKDTEKLVSYVEKGEIELAEALEMIDLEVNMYKDIDRACKNINWFNFSELYTFEVLLKNDIFKAIAIEENNASAESVKVKSTSDMQLLIEQYGGEIEMLKGLETVKAKELPTHKAQSMTKENYMDYNNKENSVKVESYVERKIFYKWQWDMIRQIGKNKNYFLEDN